jgi:hypothetical protein
MISIIFSFYLMSWFFDLNGDEEEMYLAFLFVGGKYLS